MTGLKRVLVAGTVGASVLAGGLAVGARPAHAQVWVRDVARVILRDEYGDSYFRSNWRPIERYYRSGRGGIYIRERDGDWRYYRYRRDGDGYRIRMRDGRWHHYRHHDDDDD